MGDARLTPQHGFDQPDAGGALQAVHHQVEGGMPVGRGGGVGGEVGGPCLFIGPERPCVGIDGAARVVGVEPEALDQAVGRFAAGTAELAAGNVLFAEILPAMETGDACAHYLTLVYLTLDSLT